MTQRIAWWTPQLTGGESALLQEVLDSNFLNEGEATTRFEQAVAQRVGVKHAVAATSGTAALFLATAAAGVGPGDEVIVPDITFIATANAVSLTGATPVLVDVDPRTLNMDPDSCAAAISTRTKAIMPVHVSGRSANMAALQALAEQHGLPVIEDAAEGLLSRRNGRYLGTIGQAGCLSFSPNKTITTGQGGMVLTNDDALHVRLRQLKDQGRPVRGTGGDDLHPALGYNFKLTNLQAAVGLAQLECLESRTARLREIYRQYRQGLQDIGGMVLPGFAVEEGETPQWVDALTPRRDELDKFLAGRGMGCRRFWFPLHSQPPYRRPDAGFPHSTRVSREALWLPSAFTLSDADIRQVCEAIREFFGSASC